LLEDEDKQKLADSILSKGDIHALQKKQWIGTTLHVSNWLITNLGHADSGSFESLFWIRLYATIVEFGDEFENTLKKLGADNLEMCEKLSPLNYDGKDILGDMFQIRDKARELKQLLTRDELILLENLRHSNCHILQKRYELGIKGKKDNLKLKEHKEISTTGEVLHIDEIEKILNTQMLKCGGNHLLLALDINTRVNPILKELYDSGLTQRSLSKFQTT
tara:strand:- start:75427 stop:76086 length:660 start_codon:yes stop_codon:yes gene_type:complete